MMRVLIVSLFTLIIPAPFSAPSAEIGATMETKLIAADGAASDSFGAALAMSADHVVVGAPGGYYKTAGPGAAYVFKPANGGWTQQQKLTAADPVSGSSFGNAVAVSKDTLIVGAYNHQNKKYNWYEHQGAAYVFKQENGIWAQTAKLTPGTGDNFGWFGYSVAVSDTHAFISAPVNGVDSQGAVYIFKAAGGTWTLQQILSVTDGSVDHMYGCAVAVSGDHLVVGVKWEKGADGWSMGTGAAYVYKYGGTAWDLQAKLVPLDRKKGDAFGLSVALSGNRIIVGAKGDDTLGSGSGAAYIFELVNGTWTEQARLSASDGSGGDGFGKSVAVDGNVAAVGTSLDGDKDAPGFVYVFRLENGTWKEQAKLYASDAKEEFSFGEPVVLSGSHTLVGSDRDGDNGDDAGAAYMYTLSLDSGGPCSVTIPTDLSFKFANARYQSLTGEENISLSFKYAGEKGGKLLWELEDAGIPDLLSCSTPIAPDLSFTIDNAAYHSPSFGIQDVWAGFEFNGVQNGKLMWELVGAGGK